MYRLPPDLDLSFFVGCEIQQVCVGANELILNLHPAVSITVTSRIGFTCKLEALDSYESMPAAGTAAIAFLHDTVDSAAGDEEGTLTLAFRSGRKVHFYDDSEQYESYAINHGTRVIVV